MWRAALLMLAVELTASAAPARILVDTDSGFFADDGQALVMLLRSPERVRVEGITIVSGNVWSPQGVEYTLHVLKILDRADVPLYAGAAYPLLHTPAMADVEAARWGPLDFRGAFAEPFPTSRSMLKPPFGGRFSGLAPRRESAVEFLIRSIDASPGDITVLELGPMTNLAMALRLRPEIAGKIHQLVFMGGTLRAPGNASRAAEFNFWFDPEAAAAVLRSAIPRKVMFGLDICNRAPVTKREFDQIVAVHSPVTDLFREDAGNRYPGYLKDPKATGYMWDTLAAGWLLDPGFVTARESLYLDVDTRFGPHYGAVTTLDRKLAPDATPVEVMTGLDFARIFALYKGLLAR